MRKHTHSGTWRSSIHQAAWKYPIFRKFPIKDSFPYSFRRRKISYRGLKSGSASFPKISWTQSLKKSFWESLPPKLTRWSGMCPQFRVFRFWKRARSNGRLPHHALKRSLFPRFKKMTKSSIWCSQRKLSETTASIQSAEVQILPQWKYLTTF